MSLLPSTFPTLDVHSGGAQIRRIPYNTIVLGSRSRGQTAYCVVGGGWCKLDARPRCTNNVICTP